MYFHPVLLDSLIVEKGHTSILLVLFDSLHPSQQFFSYNGTGLPGLNQY